MECKAWRFLPLVDGRMMVFEPQSHELRIYREAHEEMTIKIADAYTGVRPLPDGGYLCNVDKKVLLLDAKAQQVREWTVGSRVHDAWLLRDGRLAVATHDSVKMLGADGEMVWEHTHSMCGPMFVREPASSGR